MIDHLEDVFSVVAGTSEEEGVATHCTFALEKFEEHPGIQSIDILLCEGERERERERESFPPSRPLINSSPTSSTVPTANPPPVTGQ